MTTQSSRVGSLVSALHSAATAFFRGTLFGAVVGAVLLVVIALVMPLGRVVFDYWHSVASSLQAAPTAKPAQKK